MSESATNHRPRRKRNRRAVDAGVCVPGKPRDGDESNMTVAGKADDGLQAVQLARNLHPDVKV